MQIADRVQVMRAGRTVARRRSTETDGQELVALVTADAVSDEVPREGHKELAR
jgi:ABC-type sugar transport system ATPase subunit